MSHDASGSSPRDERIAELESAVAELRATVDGLTEELVRAKERLSEVEAATDGVSAGPGEPQAIDPSEPTESADGIVVGDDGLSAAATDTANAASSTGEAATDGGADSADAAADEEGEESDGSGDGIIVA